MTAALSGRAYCLREQRQRIASPPPESRLRRFRRSGVGEAGERRKGKKGTKKTKIEAVSVYPSRMNNDYFIQLYFSSASLHCIQSAHPDCVMASMLRSQREEKRYDRKGWKRRKSALTRARSLACAPELDQIKEKRMEGEKMR